MHFTNKIINWYTINKRDFPWRNTKDPYFIWLSEIILQQTRTAQGLPYYLSFTQKYPTVFDLANAEETEVLKLWQGLGYYSRARNLHFTAKYIVEHLDGKFPGTYKDLLQLKGVGDYTASAIASFCYDEKTAVVDGNVHRVLSRYFGINTPINSSMGNKEFKSLALELLPRTNAATYNQGIMDFGATICTPKPKCENCFLNDSCYALQKNKVADLPVKIKKTTVRRRYFNYLVPITKDQKTLLFKRTEKDIWQNLYEFKLIESKSLIDLKTLKKHKIFKGLLDQESINNTYSYYQEPVIHKLSHQHIYATFWVIEVKTRLKEAVTLQEFKKFPVPVLIQNFYRSYKDNV